MSEIASDQLMTASSRTKRQKIQLSAPPERAPQAGVPSRDSFESSVGRGPSSQSPPIQQAIRIPRLSVPEVDNFKVPVSPGRGRRSPRRSPIKPGEEDAPMLD